MSKARDLASASPAPSTVSATELGYLDGVTSAVQTQVDAKIAKSTVTAKGDLLVATGSGTVVAQPVGTNGQYLQADSTQADGVKWADVTTLPSQTSNSGKYLTTDGTTASWGTVSVPRKWNLSVAAGTATVSGNPSTSNINPSTKVVYYNGTYAFVARRYIWYSTNLITWNYQLIGASNQKTLAVNSSGTWVTGGDSNTVFSGTPGGTWTQRTSGLSGTGGVYKIIWVPSYNLFVLTGTANASPWNVISTSSDGITWTGRYQHPQGVSVSGNELVNNLSTTTVVAFSNASTNGAYSTNGTSWTAVNINNNTAYDNQIVWSPTASRFILCGGNQYSQTAANVGTAWGTAPVNYFPTFTQTPLNTANASPEPQNLYTPTYDSVNNRHIFLSSLSQPHMYMVDDNSVLTQFITGVENYYVNKVISAERLPFALAGGGTSQLQTLSYVNGYYIYVYNSAHSFHIWYSAA
jgi:hypothetical protein